MIKFPEQHRIRTGVMSSATGDDFGAFRVKLPCGEWCGVIASAGPEWEHVSASLPYRCPTWHEMCFVKRLFWSDDDCVVQYHPPKAEYVNCHPYCLHLWRPIGIELPRPPTWMVGSI